jgi:alkaline phosphatase
MFWIRSIVAVNLILCTHGFVSQADWSDDMNAYTWHKKARDTLNTQLNRKLNKNIAKNLILYLGDGMGLSTVTAGRILKGQLKKQNGKFIKTPGLSKIFLS